MPNIHINNDPKGNKQITQSMIEDLLWDPVMAAEVIMGYKLDVFQRVRLKWMWFVPDTEDDSGFSTGKTIVDWIYVNLRALLLPGHHAGVYYPYFETGKQTFWLYFDQCQAPIFKAQLGRQEFEGEKKKSAKSQGAACFRAYYRNGGQVMMPAPSFIKDANSQASLRLNTLLVDEWTHVDAMSDNWALQLYGRVTRPSFNQHHPVWKNHKHLSAPAKTRVHPATRRHDSMTREARHGNPDVHVFTFNFKDFSHFPCRTGKSFSEEFRVESALRAMKRDLSADEYLAEGLGIWAASGRGWFSDEDIEICQKKGQEMGLFPVTGSRMYEENFLKKNHETANE